MANRDKGIHTYTVQEATNVILPRLIKVNPTISATDNDDNDMAFEWVEIPNASLVEGKPVKLVSISCWDPGVSIASFDMATLNRGIVMFLLFCFINTLT